MVAVRKEFVGKGIYSVAEAALYAGIPAKTMNRWVFGDSAGAHVLDPQFGADVDKTISFLDFVQSLAIRDIRNHKRVSIPKIREAIDQAKKIYNLDYPFARRHTTYYNPINKEVIIQPEEGQFVQLTGKNKGQRYLRFVEMYLERLDFDAISGLANKFVVYSYTPAVANDGASVRIVMNPHLRFGEPLLPSGYTAKTIYRAVKAEGGIEEAADVYGIPSLEAKAAYAFYTDHLKIKDVEKPNKESGT